MTIRTHLEIDTALCGRVVELVQGQSTLELELLPVMRADSSGLVHGGFIFGAADYAAMLAVNDPNVVLAAADIRFLRPSRVGEILKVAAQIETAHERKPIVTVNIFNREGLEVFKGSFTCAVLQRHVLHGVA